MIIKKTILKDVLLIEPVEHKDFRGSFMESFRYDIISEKTKVNYKFVQDNLVQSKKNVLRGLHYQKEHPQGKLIQVLKGEIFDVAVDINKNSSTYGKWHAEVLSDKNKKQLFIPPGYAHGYCVLTDNSLVMYKCTDYYKKNDQYGIIWNDNKIGINWPVKKPIVSLKDSKLPNLTN